MNALAPPFPINPSIGEYFGNWVWNGARWVCSASTGPRVIIQTFTASGPYMPSPGLISCVVECIGGGGAGGTVQGINDALALVQGGGGGSGGYSRSALDAALVAGGVNITIGPAATPGFNGADTTFGALVIAHGGQPGATNYGTEPGLGAPAGVGDVAMPGQIGQYGSYAAIPVNAVDWIASGGGIGGMIIGGGANFAPTGPGNAANGANATPNSGAGGSGGVVNQLAAPPENNYYGGNGGTGLVIVTEYCWSDGSEDCLNPPIKVDARVAVTNVPWPGPGPCPPGWGQGGYGEYEGE